MISLYAPELPLTVYHHDEWWKDGWDPLAFGRSFDFNRPFFDQFSELMTAVPRPSIHVIGNENCEYVNQCGFSKSCYLSFNTDYSEHCFYCKNVIRSRDCIDLLHAEACELCYNSLDLHHCYSVLCSSHCKTCTDLLFCSNCVSCTDCIGCINLRGKKHCVFNRQLSPEEYKKQRNDWLSGSFERLQQLRAEAFDFFRTQPHRATEQLECENCQGNELRNCKDCCLCFDCFSDLDISYCTVTSNAKDMRDNDTGGYDCELCMEMISSGMQNARCLFGTNHWGNCSDTLYCEIMASVSHCFGCIGLRHRNYCIFNKQYSKEEYESLAAKIIEHMQKTGEWGEFFPVYRSSFAYNESVASEEFVLDESAVKNRGWDWRPVKDEIPTVSRTILAMQLPDSLADTPDDVRHWAVLCAKSGRPFKLTTKELEFHNRAALPLPRLHPDERYKERLSLRNPRKLWTRNCAKCQKPIETSYSPNRPEIVYCERCYLETVY